MIEKDEAIALRVAPYSNTSRFVLWFTRGHGRLATMIKGAQRPKSAFLGQFDLFYTCELLFYGRDRGGVHIARECTPLKTRTGLRTRWRACLFASYYGDLVARALPDGAAAPAVFDWLDAALDELAAEGSSADSVFRQELALLDRLGFRPVLDRCAGCGRAPAPGRGRVSFSAEKGGRLCETCAPGARDLRTVPADAVTVLAAWQAAATPEEAGRIRGRRAQAGAMERLLGDFLRHHLDLELESRRLAFETARRRPGSSGHAAPRPGHAARESPIATTITITTTTTNTTATRSGPGT